MDDSQEYRGDDFAVYRGKTYLAYGDGETTGLAIRVDDGDPAPEGLRPDPGDPGKFHVASPEQLEAWYSSSWTFRWKGELFSSYGVSEGKIAGFYLGRNGEFAEANLDRVGAIEYEGFFPLDQVTGFTEERTDLLAKWRERHRQDPASTT